MKYLIAAFILFLTGSLAFAQKSEYTIGARGERLVVKYKGKAHALRLGDKIDAAKITDTEILFANRKDGFIYLLLDVSGQSKEKSDDRQCGAGIESNLIWIKLDAAWKIVDARSERYESCWSGITSDDGYRINGDTLKIEFDNFRERIAVKLFYNDGEPEKGLQKQSAALKNNQ
ncbi:MAG TPA: hypothetical protein VF599_07545 [Pyrinomonadaceae bacterium]|jgi:hypothetical protein